MREKYPVDRAHQRIPPPSAGRLTEIFSAAKAGETLKKILNPHLGKEYFTTITSISMIIGPCLQKHLSSCRENKERFDLPRKNVHPPPSHPYLFRPFSPVFRNLQAAIVDYFVVM